MSILIPATMGYSTTDFAAVPADDLLDTVIREWRAMSVSNAVVAADRLGMSLDELAEAAKAGRRGPLACALDDLYLRARYIRRRKLGRTK